MSRIAMYTFGVLRGTSDDPVVAGFFERNDLNFTTAERCSGFIARSGYDDEPHREEWGEQVYPRFFRGEPEDWSPSTLSLWADLEAVFAFTYEGVHAEALAHRREWFVRPAWPTHVVWWVDDDHVPDWSEAVRRHEHLHDHGPSADCFDFRTPFDGNGQRTRIDKAKVRVRVAANRALLSSEGETSR